MKEVAVQEKGYRMRFESGPMGRWGGGGNGGEKGWKRGMGWTNFLDVHVLAVPWDQDN